jgi:hypothetical protein
MQEIECGDTIGLFKSVEDLLVDLNARDIERTRSFKCDCRREKSGVLGAKLDALVTEIRKLRVLTRPCRTKDYELSGIGGVTANATFAPDLLLIYRKSDACGLEVARSRLASRGHSDLVELVKRQCRFFQRWGLEATIAARRRIKPFFRLEN